MISDIIGDYINPPKVWGLLCIDCWDVPGNRFFYENAIIKLADFNIGAVVNCCTNLKIDYSDRSVYNTLKQYLWVDIMDGGRSPHEPEQNARVVNELIRCAGHNKTSQLLHDNIFTDTTVHLSSVAAFKHHAQTHWLHITDWIILGSAWGMCITHGPLGIAKILSISTMKFHIFPNWSVQNEKFEYVSDKELRDDRFVWSPYPAVPGCCTLIRKIKEYDESEYRTQNDRTR